MTPNLEDFLKEIKDDCIPSNREELINWVGTMQSKFQIEGGIVLPKTVPTKDSLYIAYFVEFMKKNDMGNVILIGYITIDKLYKAEFYLSNKLKPKSSLILN